MSRPKRTEHSRKLEKLRQLLLEHFPMSERDTLMSVENHLIAYLCHPSAERHQLEEARAEIRKCLDAHQPCGECYGTGWVVFDRVICVPCNNTGYLNAEVPPGAAVRSNSPIDGKPVKTRRKRTG